MKRKEMPHWKYIVTLCCGGVDESNDGFEERKKAYYYFVEHILECVAGKKEWKKDKFGTKISDAVSVSNEAFALLLLSNSWEVFEEHAMSKNEGRQKETKTRPKYTGKMGGSRRFEGWTRDGIETYNTLCRQLVKDRASVFGEQFEIEFLKYMSEKSGKKHQRSGGKNTDRRALRAWRVDDNSSFLNVQEENSIDAEKVGLEDSQPHSQPH
jgi:hypothetical protein